MDIEKRLKDHMAENADRIQVEMTDPAQITSASPARSGWIIQTVAAVVVLAVAGAGFIIASGDDGGVSEIAASEGADQVDEPSPDEAAADGTEQGGDGNGGDGQDGDGQGGDGQAARQHRQLELVSLTSDLSPGGGNVILEDDVYFLLSTAPGRVNMQDYELATEEQYMDMFRPNSFYTYEEGGSGWAVNTIEDRFISDFDVEDGVLYAISTGSKARDQASFGTSVDRGQTWEWQDVDGLTGASQVSLLAGEQPVIFASRWGHPDYERAISLAAEHGLNVPSFAVYDVNATAITYSPIAQEDLCLAVYSNIIPSFREMMKYFEEAETNGEMDGMSDAERQDILAQEQQWMTQEISRNGCEVPEDLATVEVQEYQSPDPVTVTWDELGVTAPEEWRSWAGLFRLDGNRLVEADLPFDENLQVSYHMKQAGHLNISVFDPVAQAELQAEAIRRETSGEGHEEMEELAYPEEVFWQTTDGINWSEETYRHEPQDEHEYYEGGGPFGTDPVHHRPPVAGDHAFRLWWDEEAYMEQMEALEASGATEEAMEEVWVEPTPELQRRTGNGDWQTISFDELATGIDVGDRVLREVRGSSLGVFIIFGPAFDQEGPPEDGQTVVYSGDGVNWDSFEIGGQGMYFMNNSDSLLMFVDDWDHEDGQYSKTESFLVRPVQ